MIKLPPPKKAQTRDPAASARDALARALAHSAGTLEIYLDCEANPERERLDGLYAGYQQAAQRMLQQLKNERYELVPTSAESEAA